MPSEVAAAGTVKLENDGVPALFVARFVGGPAHVQGTQPGAEAYERRTGADAVGDELGPGQEIQQRVVQDEGPDAADAVV